MGAGGKGSVVVDVASLRAFAGSFSRSASLEAIVGSLLICSESVGLPTTISFLDELLADHELLRLAVGDAADAASQASNQSTGQLDVLWRGPDSLLIDALGASLQGSQMGLLDKQLLLLESERKSAIQDGDMETVLRLELEVEELVLGLAGPELADVYILTKYFNVAFGGSAVGIDDFQSLASGAREDEIIAQLEFYGLSNELAAREYRRLVESTNDLLMDRYDFGAFDAANDKNGKPDGVIAAGDGYARLMTATEGSESLGDLILRRLVVEGYGGRARGFRHQLTSTDDHAWLEVAVQGNSPLGALTDSERKTLIDAFVSSQSMYLLSQNHIPTGLDSYGLHAESTELLRLAYAEEAAALQLAGSGNGTFEVVAAHLAAQALHQSEDPAAVIRSLESYGDVETFEVGSLAFYDTYGTTKSGLFAAALVVPDGLRGTPPGWDGISANSNGLRYRSLAAVLGALNSSTPRNGEVTAGETDFVLTLFDQLPDVYGTDSDYGDYNLGVELGTAVGRVTYDGASDRDFHIDRLARIFDTELGSKILGVSKEVDPVTRGYLTDTVIHGRRPPNSTALDFWKATDFSSDSTSIVTDLVVDTARSQVFESRGDEIDQGVQTRLEAIAQTDQGRELFGFDRPMNWETRNLLVAGMLDTPEIDKHSFSGTSSGYDNPTLNRLYVKQLLGLYESPNVQDVERLAASDEWISKAGLGADISDQYRRLLLEGALSEGWTAETFAETEHLAMNTTIAGWMSERYMTFSPTAIANLSELANDENPTRFVETALVDLIEGFDADDAGSREMITKIVETINAERKDGAHLEAIPAMLTVTGEAPAGMVLFRTLRPNGEEVVIDMNSWRYDSAASWHSENQLPPGLISVPGEGPSMETLRLQSHQSSVGVQHFATESYVDTWWERHQDKVMTGWYIVGTALVFVPPAAPAGAGMLTLRGAGTAMFAAGGLHEATSAADAWLDHRNKGGDLGWSDPYAQQAYIQALGGGLTVMTSVGALALTDDVLKLGRVPQVMKTANRTEAIYSAAAVSYQVQHVFANTEPGSEERRDQLKQLGYSLVGEALVPIAIGHTLSRAPWFSEHFHTSGDNFFAVADEWDRDKFSAASIPDQYFFLTGHSNGVAMRVRDSEDRHNVLSLDPRLMAAVIRGDHRWNGQPVVCNGCNSASDPVGGFGVEMSRLLNQKFIGPTTLSSYPNAYRPLHAKNDGYFRSLYPYELEVGSYTHDGNLVVSPDWVGDSQWAPHIFDETIHPNIHSYLGPDARRGELVARFHEPINAQNWLDQRLIHEIYQVTPSLVEGQTSAILKPKQFDVGSPSATLAKLADLHGPTLASQVFEAVGGSVKAANTALSNLRRSPFRGEERKIVSQPALVRFLIDDPDSLADLVEQHTYTLEIAAAEGSQRRSIDDVRTLAEVLEDVPTPTRLIGKPKLVDLLLEDRGAEVFTGVTIEAIEKLSNNYRNNPDPQFSGEIDYLLEMRSRLNDDKIFQSGRRDKIVRSDYLLSLITKDGGPELLATYDLSEIELVSRRLTDPAVIHQLFDTLQDLEPENRIEILRNYELAKRYL